ncbi:MAG: DUF975 family protein [Anaerovoracaceae bacterium]
METITKIKVIETSSNIRARARSILVNNWKTAIIVVLLVSVLKEAPQIVFDTLFKSEAIPNLDVNSEIMTAANQKVDSSIFSLIYMLLVYGPFTVGITHYFMKLKRNEMRGTVDVFYGFNNILRSIGAFLWMGLWIVLWVLVGLIPSSIAISSSISSGNIGAIIAGGAFGVLLSVIMISVIATILFLRYSMMFFLLLDNPDHSVRKCLKGSINLMKENKGKLLFLRLSFIPWLVAALLVVYAIEKVMAMAIGAFTVQMFDSLLMGIISAPVFAYIYAADIVFYELLTGKETGDVYIKNEY